MLKKNYITKIIKIMIIIIILIIQNRKSIILKNPLENKIVENNSTNLILSEGGYYPKSMRRNEESPPIINLNINADKYIPLNKKEIREMNNKNKDIDKEEEKKYEKQNESKQEKEAIKDDPIKRKLGYFLNNLTIDIYDKTKEQILEVIKDSVSNQKKFLDTLFQQIVSESPDFKLYARLCKELNLVLPQKIQPKEGKIEKKKLSSVMRDLLLKKCKIFFVDENDENFIE